MNMLLDKNVQNALSVAVYNHYKRVNQSETAATQDDVGAKSNICLVDQQVQVKLSWLKR